MQIEMMKRNQIEADPRNTRQLMNDEQLAELAHDISVNGILQPLTVRPHPSKKGAFMLVFGERRWRAADMIELDELPVIVRDVDELHALELQIAENNKRADIHPLEEADAYRRLHEEHGREVDEIASLCGKSTAYIYASLKLCALATEPRKAFLAGKLDKSRALLIARLPEKHQAAASKMITEQYYDGDVMSYRDAQRCIREKFMLRLSSAPFATADAGLVPKAGACTTCEKRTGNQRELFDDVISDKREGGVDVCTDSACYKQKVDVHWARLKTDAEAKGKKVIDGARYTENGGENDKKHVNLDQRAYDVGDGDKTYRQLLGKNAEGVVSAVARTEHGEIRELISRNDLPKLLKDAGVKAPKAKPAGRTAADYEREQKEQRELERAVSVAAREAALAKLDDAGDELWHLLARMLVRTATADAAREVMKLHEVKVEGEAHYSYGQRRALLAYVEKLPVLAARSFVVELLLADAGGWHEHDADQDDGERENMTGIEHAAELLGIDVPAIIKKAKADLAAARAAKTEKKVKKAAPLEVES